MAQAQRLLRLAHVEDIQPIVARRQVTIVVGQSEVPDWIGGIADSWIRARFNRVSGVAHVEHLEPIVGHRQKGVLADERDAPCAAGRSPSAKPTRGLPQVRFDAPDAERDRFRGVGHIHGRQTTPVCHKGLLVLD